MSEFLLGSEGRDRALYALISAGAAAYLLGGVAPRTTGGLRAVTVALGIYDVVVAFGFATRRGWAVTAFALSGVAVMLWACERMWELGYTHERIGMLLGGLMIASAHVLLDDLRPRPPLDLDEPQVDDEERAE